MPSTLDYYSRNAEAFASGTMYLDFSKTQDRFLRYLSSGASLLDLGCGAGRDTKYFLDHGYSVTAMDGSPELCAIASAYCGIDVRCMLFEELDAVETYDGIWACASILHLPKDQLRNVFDLIARALKSGGILYTSFKYGTFEGERNGRYFTDFTVESFGDFIASVSDLRIVEQWTTSDIRPGRNEERWLNLILRKERNS